MDRRPSLIKNSVSSALYFLLQFLILIILFSVFTLLRRWGLASAGGSGKWSAARLIPIILREGLPAACFLSLLITFLRVFMKPGSRFLTFLLLLVPATLLLVLGEIGISLYLNMDDPDPHLPPKTGSFYTSEGGAFYAETAEGGTLSPLIRIDGMDGWTFSFYPQAEYLEKDGKSILGLPTGEAREIRISDTAERIFKILPAAAGIIRDYQTLNRDLVRYMEERRNEFYLLVLALVVLTLGSQFLMRVTQWPLLNYCLLLLFIRGALFLYGTVRRELFLDEGSSSIISLAILAAGLLLFLLDTLFLPFDFWKGKR